MNVNGNISNLIGKRKKSFSLQPGKLDDINVFRKN